MLKNVSRSRFLNGQLFVLVCSDGTNGQIEIGRCLIRIPLIFMFALCGEVRSFWLALSVLEGGSFCDSTFMNLNS